MLQFAFFLFPFHIFPQMILTDKPLPPPPLSTFDEKQQVKIFVMLSFRLFRKEKLRRRLLKVHPSGGSSTILATLVFSSYSFSMLCSIAILAPKVNPFLSLAGHSALTTATPGRGGPGWPPNPEWASSGRSWERWRPAGRQSLWRTPLSARRNAPSR